MLPRGSWEGQAHPPPLKCLFGGCFPCSPHPGAHSPHLGTPGLVPPVSHHWEQGDWPLLVPPYTSGWDETPPDLGEVLGWGGLFIHPHRSRLWHVGFVPSHCSWDRVLRLLPILQRQHLLQIKRCLVLEPHRGGVSPPKLLRSGPVNKQLGFGISGSTLVSPGTNGAWERDVLVPYHPPTTQDERSCGSQTILGFGRRESCDYTHFFGGGENTRGTGRILSQPR